MAVAARQARHAMRLAGIAFVYFSVVFAFGFAFGTFRVLWLAPRVGTGTAELIEAPLMLAVVFFAARAAVRRHPELARPGQWLGIGTASLSLLLAVEFTIVLGLRGLTLGQYLESREPVPTIVYVVLLVAFAAMPLAVFGGRRSVPAEPLQATSRGCRHER